jgi:Xaa-Pro aminopeptidase
MAMQPGMITSIEPGVYRPGHWGVRIESLALAVPVDAGALAPSACWPSGADAVPDRHPLHRQGVVAPDDASGSIATDAGA